MGAWVGGGASAYTGSGRWGAARRGEDVWVLAVVVRCCASVMGVLWNALLPLMERAVVVRGVWRWLEKHGSGIGAVVMVSC